MLRSRFINKFKTFNLSRGLRRQHKEQTRKLVRPMLESLEQRLVPNGDPTSCVGGNVDVHFYGHDHSPAFVLPVDVHDQKGGEANSGTVTCSLVSGKDKIVLGTADVDKHGHADCNIKLGALPDNLKPGHYKVELDYGGDHDFDASNTVCDLDVDSISTAIVPVNVSIGLPKPTPTNSAPAPSSFTITVGVNCSSTTVNEGTVTLDLVQGNKTIVLGSGTVGSNGKATISVTDKNILEELADLKPGHYKLVENFSGSDTFASCSTSATFTISAPTTITVPPVTVSAGSTTTFNLTVNVNTSSGPATSGTVTIDLVEGGKTIVLGTATVGSNGKATISVTDKNILKELAALKPGKYTLVENFSGSDTFASCSTTATFTITEPTAITVPPVTLSAGSTTTFNLTVNVNTSSGPATSGTVTIDLISGGKTIVLGTATVGSNGKATISVTDKNILKELAALKPGKYTLVENFSGSEVFASGSTTATLTITSVPTTITVPTITIPAGSSSTFTINLNVNTPSGPPPSGSVNINLVVNGKTIPLGTGTVGPNGTVTINVSGQPAATLASLAPGQYDLVVNFTGSAGSPASNGSTVGTLAIQPTVPTIQPTAIVTSPTSTSSGPGNGGSTPPIAPAPNPLLAALELALDLGALSTMGNPGAMGELQAFANTFLGHSLPTTVPGLMQDIQTQLPAVGPYFGPALSFGGFLAQDLPIENPM